MVVQNSPLPLLGLAVFVVAGISSILRVEVGQEAAELAVQVVDVPVVSISLAAPLRIRLEERQGSHLSKTCPSRSPIAPDMDGTPSHHC